ncbi:MAG: class II fructose-bisphosphate aldolase [Erysipelotrichaceae bacterium]|nr:class II fructose-bisphosphate aldolase [Erysipelotrichaceae bacterium]
MLVSMKEICAVARENHFGVPALGVNNEHSIRAAVEAAEEKNSPLILLITYGAHPDFVYFGQTAAEIAKASFVPVATILDHGPSWDTCVWAVRAGLTDMMIDKSSKPYEENAAEVKAAVKLAHVVGMGVEAELGHVGSGENYAVDGHTAFTDPDEAVKFVEETGCDYLAVAVGTAHGVYKGKPELHFDLLQTLRDKVSVPLVLHGGSGSGDENITKACELGICKVNLANDLYRGMAQGLIDADISGNGVYMAYNFLTTGYKNVAKHYMDVCKSTGKASLYNIKNLGITGKGVSEDGDVREA